MKLFASPTSPYARIAAVICIEARLPGLEIAILDPWTNPPDLLAANPSGRVPALILKDQGTALTECMLIAEFAVHHPAAPAGLWFESDAERAIAGQCMGVIDSAAHVMAGRMVTSGNVGDPAFDTSPVARRRQAAMDRSLDRLEEMLAAADLAARPGMAAFLPVIAVEYLRMRFGTAHDSENRPHLARMLAALSERPSLKATRPLFVGFDAKEAGL